MCRAPSFSLVTFFTEDLWWLSHWKLRRNYTFNPMLSVQSREVFNDHLKLLMERYLWGTYTSIWQNFNFWQIFEPFGQLIKASSVIDCIEMQRCWSQNAIQVTYAWASSVMMMKCWWWKERRACTRVPWDLVSFSKEWGDINRFKILGDRCFINRK